MISFPFPPIGNSFVACSMPKVLHAPAECVKLVIFFDLVMLARITSSGLHARTDTHTQTQKCHTHTQTHAHTQTHTHRHTHTYTHRDTHRHTHCLLQESFSATGSRFLRFLGCVSARNTWLISLLDFKGAPDLSSMKFWSLETGWWGLA